MNMNNLSPEEKMELLKLLSIKSDYEKYNKIEYFRPYRWQLEKLFPTGVSESVRGLLAANQIGKSYGATYELACHVTGRYADWWNGHVFDGPIDTLVLGYDYSQMAKPNCILELIFGKQEDTGSGFIPKKDIIKLEMKTGYKGVVGKAYIQHYNRNGDKDGISTITTGAYSAGFENFMGSQFKFIYIDEQPRDKNILPQCIKRQAIFNGEGRLLATFTPEMG